MPTSKKNEEKESLLRRVGKQRLKYITVLPSLITILNGVCGFAAIICASKVQVSGDNLRLTPFAMSGYLILVAMVADVLDGRVARMSKSTSSFGGQLDSLCDVISFGVAPAFLVVKILSYKLGIAGMNEVFESYLCRFIWLAAAVYISCTAIRLARFNVENEEDESAHMSFIGLPTPAAAGVIVSLVIFHQEVLLELSAKSPQVSSILGTAILCVLPVLLLCMGILMVSRIRYPHVVNQYIKGKKPFTHLIKLLFAIGLIIWSWQTASVLIFCSFAASGFVKWSYYRIIHGKNYSTLLVEEANSIASSLGNTTEL